MEIYRKPVFKFRFPFFLFILLVVGSGTLLALSTGGFVVNFKELGFSVLSTLQKGGYAFTSRIGNTFTAVRDISVLRQDYEKLTEVLKDYEYLQQSNAEIRAENIRLKEQIGFSRNFEYTNHPAIIVGRDPDSMYSALTINKGSRDNIRKNMLVIAVQNGMVGLVGKVLSVGLETSMVMPIYDFQCNISARIKKTRDIGLVSGLGSDDVPLSMRYIKKKALGDLQYGDIVVTSGENGNYLRDIPIGTISRISIVDYDSSLGIDLTPILDFSRLESVVVIDMDAPISSVSAPKGAN